MCFRLQRSPHSMIPILIPVTLKLIPIPVTLISIPSPFSTSDYHQFLAFLGLICCIGIQYYTVDVITTVAMFTIVTINHSCRNHNCRKKSKLSQLQPQLSQSWSTTIFATLITNVASFININFVQIMTFHPIFNNPCFTSHNLTMTNCEILWHIIRLSYYCGNFDIEIVTFVKYLKSLLCFMKKK